MVGLALNGKQVNLEQLRAEMVTAGLAVTGLGSDGTNVFTFNASGQYADLPAGADAVLAAHVPHPDQAVMQRIADVLEVLNAPATTDTQAHRDAFARILGVHPLTIPLNQAAVASDIHPI